MKLLTKEIEKKLPAFYETEEIPIAEKIVQVKYFCPWGSLTWYGVEFDPKTNVFFGFAKSIFSLSIKLRPEADVNLAPLLKIGK